MSVYKKLLFPALSYTESLCRRGLERLDDRRDMITQSMFRQIKDPKHPIYYLLPPVKVSHSQIVLRPTKGGFNGRPLVQWPTRPLGGWVSFWWPRKAKLWLAIAKSWLQLELIL